VFLIASYHDIPTEFWEAPRWLRWFFVFLMLPAFIMFVASIATPSGTSLSGDMARPVRGIHRITRHPMLWAFAIWAAVHMICEADTNAFVFFGTFVVTALAGMFSIDRKLARREPGAWAQLAATTSILPFLAILQGRNQLVIDEIGLPALIGGPAAWLGVLALHKMLFGASPMPW
jgi:uncharacterized membrane protein